MLGFLDKKTILTELSPKMELVSLNPDELVSKIFEPYEHLFFKRISYDAYTVGYQISGGQVEVSAGYTILSIQNYSKISGRDYGSHTAGVDIWFTNTATVKAQPVYNEYIKCYEYTEPGEVISLEEEPRVLQRTQE